MNNYCKTLVKAKPFVQTLTGKDADKALMDLARSLASALFESGIEIEDFILSYERDEMFNPDCLFGDHNSVYDYVKPKYREIAKILFDYRPVGLGTPNAAVGEGEFMCIALSPRVGIAKKKNTGDISVDETRFVEMKGDQIRIMFDEITGPELQRHAESVSREFDIEPNKVNRKRLAYEPWGMSLPKISHWQQEFKRIGKDKAIDFLRLLFKPITTYEKEKLEECFTNDIFEPRVLNKILLKTFFRLMEKKWEAFTIIESNGCIISISSDPDEFDRMVDDDIIVVTTDYFRSFSAGAKLGLYCKHV